MATPEHRFRSAMARIGERTRGRPATGVSHDEADETTGSIESDHAAGFDPMPLLRALSDRGAPAVVIGQVAGILHGSAELTGDLDLLWSGEPSDMPSMAAAFAALDAWLTTDDGVTIAGPAAAFELPKVLFETPTVAGDCCTPRLAWGGMDVAAFLPRAQTTRIDGVLVRYLALEDLIAMRRAAARPKDLRRAEELEGSRRPRTPGS